MPKSLSSLWLKNMKRMGKVQQAQQAQGRKLFLSLLPPALGLTPRRRPKTVKPPKLLKLVNPVVPKTRSARVAKSGVGRAATDRRSAARQPTLVSGASHTPEPHHLPGTWKSFYFSHGEFPHARRMLYWLYLPARPRADSAGAQPPMPLVVMLHGCEQSATDFATATRMNALAQRKGFAVLYPQQSADADSHRCWHWYKRPTQEGYGDVQLIAHMTAHVQARHGLDTARTYVAGLSAGAGLASILALRHPALVAAVGLHSAPVFGTTDSPMSAYGVMQHGSALAHSDAAHTLVRNQPGHPGMPVILIHGDGDTVVRPVNVQHLSDQFVIFNAGALGRAEPTHRRYAARAGGRSPRHGYQTTTYYAGRKPQLVKCEIDGMGHAWSGGDPSVNFTEPQGPDASLMMWTFFTRHQRAATAVATEPVVADDAAA